MGKTSSNMIVYKCIVNESEFVTDAQTEAEDVETLFGGCVKKVPARYIEVGEEDIDIGANASAEGGDADEGVDDNKKKEYMTYMKGFCKKIVQYKKANGLEDEVASFKENVQEALKAITAEWDEYCCYVNVDYDCEGSTVLCRYDADANPFFYYFMDGFSATKY